MGKKIAIIYYAGFLSSSGGAYMHACILKDVLSSARWTVELYTLDSLPLLVRYIPHLALKILNALFPPSGFLVKGKLISLLFRLLKPSKNADLVVFEDIYSAWHAEEPSVAILHAVWSDNLEGKRISRKNFRKLVQKESQILCSLKCPVATVSESYYDFIVSSHFAGLAIPSISCIQLGVDIGYIASFKKDAEERDPFGIAFSGACIERKNLPLLLDVVELLVSDGNPWCLTIIGDGPLLNSLKSSAHARRLPVRFAGRLDHQELLQELALHSIYVHPSTKESFSFSLLEAKILGLKTCAHHGLEVPAEFVDEKLNSFSPHEWVFAVRKSRVSDYAIRDLSKFSSSLMADSLICLASPKQSPGVALTYKSQ